ncbi:S8 family serine peptidase [Peribacillus butanolivorans]|uniref:S8 family serine peptidase n=1 Tax=Peribacillus butanolivorans TaxID=421767 RepID=UPI00366E7A85
MLEKFKNILLKNNINGDSMRVKTYLNGPTFVSVYLNRRALIDVSDFNPLRTVHPLRVDFFPELRSSKSNPLMLKPPVGQNISQIRVGIFDGGIDTTHPLLVNYAKENKSVKSNPIRQGVDHGTAVAGVVLYGDLNQYEANSQLTINTFKFVSTLSGVDLLKQSF